MNHSLLDSYGFQVILKLKQTKVIETVAYYKSTGTLRINANDSFCPLWKYFIHYIKMVSVVLENITIIDLFFYKFAVFYLNSFHLQYIICFIVGSMLSCEHINLNRGLAIFLMHVE